MYLDPLAQYTLTYHQTLNCQSPFRDQMTHLNNNHKVGIAHIALFKVAKTVGISHPNVYHWVLLGFLTFKL